MEERYMVAGLVRAFQKELPDSPALTLDSTTLTWSQLYRRACRVGNVLAASGVVAGDRVAFLDRNSLQAFEVILGGALIGAVHVPLNWRIAPAEISAVLDDSQAEVLVVHPEYLEGVLEGWQANGPSDVVPSDTPPLGSLRHVIVIDADQTATSDHDHELGLPEREGVRFSSYEQSLGRVSDEDPGWSPQPDEVFIQIYTSGTTGRPKGVMLTNANLNAALTAGATLFNISADTVSLVAMPLFHIGGAAWALAGMSRGGHSVILRDVDPIELLRIVETYGVTETFLVPAVLSFLLIMPETRTTDLSSLRNIFYGASPITDDVLDGCLKTFGCEFTQVYGMTETTAVISSLKPEDHDPGGPRAGLLRSAGRAVTGVEIKVVDPDSGADLPPGQVGEVLTRSAFVMVGYWKQPDETARILGNDGWLHTGDAGYLDAEGYLYLSDRIKDMIVSGGENIYPAEIENVLASHPSVADVAVIGVPDDKWGEAVKGVVVLSPGAAVDARELLAYCHTRLAGYKCPKSIDFVESLPRNLAGKVLKRELRAPYWVGHERSIQ